MKIKKQNKGQVVMVKCGRHGGESEHEQ